MAQPTTTCAVRFTRPSLLRCCCVTSGARANRQNWRRHIKWTQENFRSGGHQAELLPLLERCTRSLQASGTYNHDIRYLRVWIQYVSVCCYLYLRLALPDTVAKQQNAQCQQGLYQFLLLCFQADCLPEPQDVFSFLKVHPPGDFERAFTYLTALC